MTNKPKLALLAEPEKEQFVCPVCFYDRMAYPPRDYHICPSCGTEFGYDDASRSHGDLRDEWIKAGCPWFSEATPRPTDWEPKI